MSQSSAEPAVAIRKPWKAALARLFGRPLRIVCGERELTFRHPAEFEFSLGGRISVSLVKVVEFLHRSPKSLRREAIFVDLIQRQLTRVIDACREPPGDTGALLKEIGLKSFTTEYRWRSIFESLASGGAEIDDYRYVAMLRYQQYLESRREALGIVFYHKTGKALIADDDELVGEPAPQSKTGFATTGSATAQAA